MFPCHPFVLSGELVESEAFSARFPVDMQKRRNGGYKFVKRTCFILVESYFNDPRFHRYMPRRDKSIHDPLVVINSPADELTKL
jgi:hypothetical protein